MTPMSNIAASFSSSSSCYLNNANKIAPFTIIPPPLSTSTSLPSSSNHDQKLQVKDFESQIKEMIQTILPSFLEDEQGSTNISNRIKIQPLEGGLSNHLFTVTNQTTHSTILIRIHPTRSNSSSNPSIDLINRKHENHIASFVSKYNIGPKFYGRFKNGRIEEYFSNVKTLRYDEMSIPYYAMGIAKQMSMLHSLDVDEIKSNCYNDNDNNLDSYDGDIWSRINQWLYISKQLLAKKFDLTNNKSMTKENLIKLHSIVETIEYEWKWYQQEMINKSTKQVKNRGGIIIDESMKEKAMKFCRDIVFTHMDCQSLNILTPIPSMSSLSKCHSILSFTRINDDHPEMEESSDNSSISSSHSHHNTESTTMDENESSKMTAETNNVASIHIIDYEYASFNRRVIDIANTFLEHCDMNNLKPNYELEYPSKEEQNLFLSCYLHQCGKSDTSLFWLRDLFEEEGVFISRGGCKTEKDEFLDVVRNEVTKHTLFSHLQWSSWSIIQSIQCNIEFDYLKYAEIRMKGYFYFKNLCWK
jgi:thiamine kinase-like enzyme